MGYTPNPGSLTTGTSPNFTQVYQPALNENFSAVGGQVATQTVIRSLYDYDPYAIAQEVMHRHSKLSVFKLLLGMMNGSRGVSAPLTGHYERDWLMNTIKFNAAATGTSGAGNDANVLVHADCLYDAGAKQGGAARAASILREGDVITFPNGEQAYVVSKTVTGTTAASHAAVLRPLKSTVNIFPLIVANTNYAITSNMFGEGTGLPGTIVPRLFKYTNSFQIVKEAFGATGTELTNQTFVQFRHGTNGSIAVVLKDDMVYRFERATSNALLFGQEVTNPNMIANNPSQIGHDVPLIGTQGFIDFVAQFGHTLAYTAGAYTLDNFDQLAAVYESERVAEREIMTLDGYNVFIATENALKGEFDGDMTPFLMNRLAGGMGINTGGAEFQPFNEKDFSFYLGFKAVKKAGYAFYFRQLHEFNDVTSVGATGYNFNARRYAMPIGITEDKNNGGGRAYIGYDYKAQGGYNRQAVIATVAGVGVAGSGGYYPVTMAGNEFDAMKTGLVSELAFHGTCPNLVMAHLPS